MRLAVDSTGQAADHGEALGGKLEAETLRHPAADVAGGARADDRDTSGVGQRRRAADEQEWRRVGDLAQIWGIVGVAHLNQAGPDCWAARTVPFSSGSKSRNSQILRAVLRGTPAAAILVGGELEYFFRRTELFY